MSAWLEHVKKTRKEMQEKAGKGVTIMLKDVLKAAKKTYKAVSHVATSVKSTVVGEKRRARTMKKSKKSNKSKKSKNSKNSKKSKKSKKSRGRK